jgi:hypothetical protein
MTNLLEMTGGLSIALKGAWAVLLLWSAWQYIWYRQAHVVVLSPMAPSPRRKSTRSPNEAEHGEHAVPI